MDKVDWSKRNTPEGCEEIARAHYHWAQQLAELAITHTAVACDPDDLRSAAGLGLLQAIRSFDPNRGVKFRTHAINRIRGAIADSMRNQDKLSRQGRSIVKARQSVEIRLMPILGRLPTQDEVCAELGWEPMQYLRSLQGVDERLDRTVHEFDDSGKIDSLAMRLGNRDAVSELERDGAFEQLMQGFRFEEQVLMFLYYYRGATMKQIGAVLHLSESRISQLHAEILDRLRSTGRSFH